jgi:hypothetical protein
MTKTGATLHLRGMLIAATVLLAGMAMPAAAQRSSGATVAQGDDASRTGAGKPAKARANKRTATSNQRKTRPAPKDPWRIDDALLTRQPGAVAGEDLTPAKPSFGRMRLDTGSFGLTTESHVKDNQFSDGRRVPGLETEKRNTPSYFGLSLSVPTRNNTLMPLPFWDRKE